MLCPRCSFSFRANWQVSRSAPGILLICAALFGATGLLLLLLGLPLWGWAGVAIGVVLGLQVLTAWHDCRRCHCPQCKERVRVMPWSL